MRDLLLVVLPEGYSKTSEVYSLGEEGPEISSLFSSTDSSFRAEMEETSSFSLLSNLPVALEMILFSVTIFLTIWSSRDPQIMVLVTEDWEGRDEDSDPSFLDQIP